MNTSDAGQSGSTAPMTTNDESSLVLLEALLASAPVGIAFLDGDLRIVRVNDALAAVLGRPVEECIGRSAREHPRPLSDARHRPHRVPVQRAQV